MANRKERELELDLDYKNTIQSYTRISPDELIRLANILKENNISSLEITEDYGSVRIYYYTIESESEAEIREIEERKENEALLLKRKQWAKEEAIKYGFKIIEE